MNNRVIEYGENIPKDKILAVFDGIGEVFDKNDVSVGESLDILALFLHSTIECCSKDRLDKVQTYARLMLYFACKSNDIPLPIPNGGVPPTE